MHPDDIYPIFIKWFAMPAESRDPRTIPEFAEKMQIPLSLIAEFNNKETFSDDLYRAAKEWGKSKIPELLHTLYRRYKERQNPSDLKMYKELLELDKQDKSGPVINVNLFNPSDDQYRQIIARESKSLFGARENALPAPEDSGS
jgi:hypothetical protein